MLQELHRQGNTVVLITHDNSIAVQAQRIIRLEDGRVVYDGDAHAPEAVVQRRQMLTQTGSMGEKLYRDALTGLYNRRYYEDALKNRSMEAGVAVLDMDGTDRRMSSSPGSRVSLIWQQISCNFC